MKPIKLTLRAFGPYKNEEVIDFTQLQDHRLFVISGSTGAGKTTIFDGICFALYGYGSGQDRKETKTLRSDFAENNVHTAVELIFDIHGKRYRVLRQLSHIKEGRKTATGEKYELFEIVSPDQELPVVERQKVTDINQKLEEIIGLTYDQFSQIVMLPQGEFRKLLTSQSDNKEEILRKIFKTNRYGEMTQKLEAKKREAEQKLNEANALRKGYIGQLTGAIPQREDSTLFLVLNQNSNIYQIQQALDEEVQYYQQKIVENQKKYNEVLKIHHEKYERYVAQKALNERIEAYERKVEKLQEISLQKMHFENIKAEYEASIQANRIEPLNKQCHSLNEEKINYQNQWSQVTERLNHAKATLASSQRIFLLEQQKQNEREEALQQVLELQKLLPIYQQIDQQARYVKLLKVETEQAQQSLINAEKLLSDKKSVIEKVQSVIEQLEQETQNLNALLEEQAHLREVVKVLQQFNEIEKRVKSLKDEVEVNTVHYQQVKEIYDREESKWLNNQAALLAATLVPGTPCPVCGGTDHQANHREITELIDEQNLKQMKVALTNAEQKKFTVEAKHHAAVEQLNECKIELQRLGASTDQHSQLILKFREVNQSVGHLQVSQEKLSQNKQQLKQLQLESAQFEQQQKQIEQVWRQKNEQLLQQQTILEQQQLSIPKGLQHLSQLQQALKQAETHKNQLQALWEKAQTQYQEAQTVVATTEEALKHITISLKQSEEKLEKAKEEFKKSMLDAGFENYKQFDAAKRTEQQQKQLQQQYVNYTNELHALTTQVNEEREHLMGKERMDLTELVRQVQELELASQNASTKLNQSKEYERTCIGFSEKLDRIAEEIQQLEEVSHQIMDLYNLLRGQNSKKISFERYVQMGYLEQITEAANIRLRNLSNGQYYLQCSDRQEAHGRQSGLSLDVYDTYTGQSRDVKSLSGGEKFNASLCLALGMADVIQSFQGNVKIDTMFIDEGFGSLDEESLMKAIDALIDLQKSGRMIGVISHVAELKAAMPALLHVEKLKEGYSRTSIIIK